MLPRPRPEPDAVRDRLRALVAGAEAGPSGDGADGGAPLGPRWIAPPSMRPVLIAIGATALAVWIVLRTFGGGAPTPVSLEPGTPMVAPSAAAGLPLATPTPTPSVVVVHVLGDVRRPGLVTLPAGSRVADAVEAAGGLRKGGSTGSLNLARTLVDGEQVLVSHDAVAAPDSGGGGTATGPLDLNTATADQLDELPGVGPVMAERILAWRTEHGRFASVDQLREVPGIGAVTFERLAPLVRV